MLSLKEGEPLAKSVNGKTTIFYTASKKIPAILDCHPLDSVSREFLYKIKKKYRLKNTFFKNLVRAYSKKSDTFSCSANNIAEELACSELEKHCIWQMKNVYKNEELNLLPWLNLEDSQKVASHVHVCASSSSGKTFLAAQLIETNVAKEIQKHVKVYVLISNPTDENWVAFKKKYSGTVIIIDTRKLQLPIGLMQLDKGSILCCDDAESNTREVQQIIADLERVVIIKGRKHASKYMGTVLISIRHDAFCGSKTKYHSNIGRVIVFPSVNRHLATKILKNKVGFSQKEVNEALDFVPHGRYSYLYIQTNPAPGFLCTKNGVKLL